MATEKVGGDFEAQVARVIRSIPKGETLAYGAVAALAGRYGGARSVARALRTLKNVPWWRVIRSDGTMAPEVAAQQSQRLVAEGLSVKGKRVRHRAQATS